MNKTILTFILLKEIHHHGKYLDLTFDKVTRHKLSILSDFIECHDEWLGKIPNPFITTKPFPFVKIPPKKTSKNMVTDKFADLTKLGWTVVDVVSDGNCGFYCLILGLENIGRTEYSIRQPSTFEMAMYRNVPWQFNVMRLRQQLQQESRSLLRNLYPPESRQADWFTYTSATNDDEYDELTNFYYDRELKQQTYFDGTLCNKENYKYHMTPYWGAHVFACLFRIHVVVYTRTSQWDGQKVNYTWSTVTTSPFLPMNQ